MFFFLRFGPRLSSALGSSFVALGCILMGISTLDQLDNLYFISFFFMSAGGPLIFMATCSFSNFFPEKAGIFSTFFPTPTRRFLPIKNWCIHVALEDWKTFYPEKVFLFFFFFLQWRKNVFLFFLEDLLRGFVLDASMHRLLYFQCLPSFFISIKLALIFQFFITAQLWSLPVFILFVFTPINQYPIDKDKVLLTESKWFLVFFNFLSPFSPPCTVLKFFCE